MIINSRQQQGIQSQLSLIQEMTEIPQHAGTIIIDVSWETSKKTGIGIMKFSPTEILTYLSY